MKAGVSMNGFLSGHFEGITQLFEKLLIVDWQLNPPDLAA